jgi:hypothetical protein
MAGKPRPKRTPAEVKHAAEERERYRRMSLDERRAAMARRSREAQQEGDRRYAATSDKRPVTQRAYQAKDRQSGAHDAERKARATVALAKATGRLKPPARCQNCGAAGPLQAHHPDHAKRTEVTWLCSSCHGKTERTLPS